MDAAKTPRVSLKYPTGAAAQRLLPLLSGVRQRGADRWIARCPAHEDHSPSLTIRQTHDRVLLYCWAGCKAVDICAAIGLTLADLYHDRRGSSPDPALLRRRRAAEGLECWRQAEIRRCAEDLRTRDIVILQIDASVAEGAITEDEAWISLEYEFRGYSDLEHRFHRLIQNDGVLDLWRGMAA
jgi:hypothetical protein